MRGPSVLVSMASDMPSMIQHQADVDQLSELLPGLSSAVRSLARAAKTVPDASDIYVSVALLR